MPETTTDPAAPAAAPGARQRPASRFPVVLEGQPALVTGANSGIGKAVALGLAASGADVVVNYIVDSAAAEEVAHQIEAGGRRALAIKADVSREDEVQAMFATAVDHFGTLHIVVNNAGLQRDAPLLDMTIEQWNKVIAVNLTGQFLCAREAVREFKRRGVAPEISVAAGKIVFMSSVHQEIPWAGHANYAASKGGVMQLMRSIACGQGQRRGAGSHTYANQPPGLGNLRSLSQADDSRALQTHWRTRGHCPGRCLACLGYG